MKDRIKLLMESQHMNQQSFASFIGISTASLSSILQEKTRPTLKTVEAICSKMPSVNITWLLNGVGEMYSSSPEVSSAAENSEPDLFHQSSGQPSLYENAEFMEPRNNAFRSSPSFTNQPTSPSTDYRQQRIPSGMSFHEEKKVDIKHRRITEIRVFYDDQTWESFVPKK